MDAMTGSYVLYTIMTQALPRLPGIPKELTGLSNDSNVMSKEAFKSLQRDCLSACQEIIVKDVQQEFPVNVILANGSWGVEGISDDVMLVVALTVHSLLFNVISFFDESALNQVGDSFKDLDQFKVKE
jgi:hypothetical protein